MIPLCQCPSTRSSSLPICLIRQNIGITSDHRWIDSSRCLERSAILPDGSLGPIVCRPLVTFIPSRLLRSFVVRTKPVAGDQEEKAAEFVEDFLEPFLDGSENFVQEYSPGTATPVVTKGEVAVAAQSLLLWKNSNRIERLTRWLIALTGALVALTVILAILTWRLGG